MSDGDEAEGEVWRAKKPTGYFNLHVGVPRTGGVKGVYMECTRTAIGCNMALSVRIDWLPGGAPDSQV